MWCEGVAIGMNYLLLYGDHSIDLLEGMLLSKKRQPSFCVLNIEEHVFQG